MTEKPSVREPDRRPFQPATIGTNAWIVLGILLALPAVALFRLSATIDWRLLAGVPLLISLVTYLAYRSDKKRAQAGEWRVPESTLHILELGGGWPGAFLGQRRYRHKTSKLSFQVMFWLVVLIHQFLALDYLLRWAFIGGAIHVIRSRLQ